MLRVILFTVLTLILIMPAYSSDLGNPINTKEYPEEVLPVKKNSSNLVISGSIEKTIDMSLENCIKLALGNNPEINAAFQDVLASNVRIRQVWSKYFPSFSWQTSGTHIRQLQLSDALGENLEFNYYLAGQITLQQMLYDFGVTQNQATIKKLNYDEYKKTFEAKVNDVIYRTKDAYYYVLYAYENKRISEASVNKYQIFYNQAKAFYKIGMNPKVDVTIAETNLSNAKLKLIRAENNVNIAIAQLNNIMGLPYIEKYDIPDKLKYTPIKIEFEEAINTARNSRPELKIAEIRVEEARQTLKLAKKAFYPSISFEGQYQRGGKSFNSNYGYNIGGYLIFPTINGVLIKNEIKEARYLYDKELANARNTQNSIYLEIQKSFLKLEEKQNQLPVAILQVKQAKENYELSYGRYRVGEASPVEVKEAETTYSDALFTYASSLYEYNSAKALLEKVIGKNIVDSRDVVSLQ